MASNSIIDHLFEFWEHIGFHGAFLKKESNYKYTIPNDKSWPSKIFGVNTATLNFEQLHQGMKDNSLPNSIGIAEDALAEKLLLNHDFKQTSIVKGMHLKLPKTQKNKEDFSTIIEVDNPDKAIQFANISSQSFGYKILPSTIISLVNNSTKVRLFLGKYNTNLVSCGILYLDKNGVSGIHMIGTLPEYRSLGLGKMMTKKLLNEAYVNRSEKVVLVASKAGERIYSKIGFIADEALKSYTVNQ